MNPSTLKIIARLLFLGFLVLGILAAIVPRARVLLLCCAMAFVLAPDFLEGILPKHGKLKPPWNPV